uniref:Uncharacterized protein n=1 Tax=Anguilla anguilla TaxID=7936 RepID=A0A0E9VTQ3_ANGAN
MEITLLIMFYVECSSWGFRCVDSHQDR